MFTRRIKYEKKKAIICGSLSQLHFIQSIAVRYELDGYDIIKMPRNLDGTGVSLYEELTDYIQKMSESDLVIIVLKPDGSLGEATTYELCMAEFMKKCIKII